MAQAAARAGRLSSIPRRTVGQQQVRRAGGRAALARPQAARVCGTEIPNNKPLYISLTRVYGIGETRAWETLAACNVENKRVRDLSESELARIRDHVSSTYTVEGDLRRERNMAIKRLIEIQCLRGQRHQKNLPVRGQRTQTNARTRKGFKKTVSRGKK